MVCCECHAQGCGVYAVEDTRSTLDMRSLKSLPPLLPRAERLCRVFDDHLEEALARCGRAVPSGIIDEHVLRSIAAHHMLGCQEI